MASRDEQVIRAFSAVLRDLRRKRGLTQEELAHECGYDRSFISLIERAKRQPSLTTIFALAEQLDVRPEEIVRQTSKRSTSRK